jgi:hypothetical protein
MSQFTSTARRASGEIDVYTGLLCVAFLVLAVGAFLLARKNLEHSAVRGSEGGLFKLVEARR